MLCHADINGAMNIARKFQPEFTMEKLSLKYKRQQIFAYRLVKLENYTVSKGILAELR